MLLAAIFILGAGTFVSEDLTCIAAGLAVREGRLRLAHALAGCFIGIYLGDLALWSTQR